MIRRILIVVAGVLALSTPASAYQYKATVYIPAIGVYAHEASTLEEGIVPFYRDEDSLVLSAHRTHGPHLFLYLNHLRKGDLIRAEGKNYYVKKTLVVGAKAVWVTRYKGLVLTACSQPDGTPTNINYRIAVFASLTR